MSEVALCSRAAASSRRSPAARCTGGAWCSPWRGRPLCRCGPADGLRMARAVPGSDGPHSQPPRHSPRSVKRIRRSTVGVRDSVTGAGGYVGSKPTVAGFAWTCPHRLTLGGASDVRQAGSARLSLGGGHGAPAARRAHGADRIVWGALLTVPRRAKPDRAFFAAARAAGVGGRRTPVRVLTRLAANCRDGRVPARVGSGIRPGSESGSVLLRRRHAPRLRD